MKLLFCVLAFVVLINAYDPFKNIDLEDLKNMKNPVITQKAVDEINAMNAGWEASVDQGSFVSDIDVAEFQRYLGVKLDGKGPQLRTKLDEEYNVQFEDLPKNFDSRTNWPGCPTMRWIRDQSSCGSCWAFGSSEAISDRYCTYKINDNLNISSADILACCDSCGDGCNGGYPSAAWQYWVQTGVVDSDCYPYPFPSCDHHIPNSKNPCPSTDFPTPSCPNQCKNGKSWSSEKHFGADAWNVHGMESIMKEIYENGPVGTAFSVYSDFPTYKSGVYRRTSSTFLGGHAVKFLGWGETDDGTKYWIVANSWNPNWGMGGTFWILRGVNECGIESSANAGKPKM